ncbi:Methyltransferase domain-containing protein [Marininema mesophilum]|uniref:Methyltransferase domain-containing protein n=1 Tax=Marininema mesophilum TaxID=1048340 RepID=A0A1H3BI55_9BACL|nr:class I SAM-dependent methyltransferase [Marininema mesophilum]SDX41616.1 Methyltransferase domain-containing protein [Marininema mesophilum]
MPYNLYETRFIRESDPKTDHLVFPLPKEWWSRGYEYEWAKNFAHHNETVLDAACGLSHPLKFYLAQRCKEVHACDINPGILSEQKIIQELESTLGNDQFNEKISCILKNIHFSQANITKLPYSAFHFDKIFCISVLEHLSSVQQKLALKEFAHILKPDGLIVLTFDFPTIDLNTFKEMIETEEFDFATIHSFEQPSDVLSTNMYGKLQCYRAILKKKTSTKQLLSHSIKTLKSIT